MALLITTIASAAANSYNTIEEIDEYLDEQMINTSAWNDAFTAWDGWFVNDATLQVGDTSIPVDSGTGTLSKHDVVKFADHTTLYEVNAFSSTPLVLQSGLTAIPSDNEAITKVYDIQQLRVAILATKLLDAYFDWEGAPATVNQQALRWPRIGVLTRDQEEYDSNIIPDFIKRAHAALCMELLARDRLSDPALLGLGFSQGKSGTSDVTVDRRMVLDWIPAYIVAMVSHAGGLINEAQRFGGNVPLRRG